MRPVRIISIAFALPTARVSRCVPPMPGMTPSLISGWPNLALSAAMTMSHCMASSQPPPSAKPATAATIGLRAREARSQVPVKLPRKASMKVLSAISLMSAPAAKAFSLPVISMQPIASSASKASIACDNSALERRVERIELGRPVEPDDADAAFGLDDDVLVAHGAPGLYCHGRACPGHPRFKDMKQDVDARHKVVLGPAEAGPGAGRRGVISGTGQ